MTRRWRGRSLARLQLDARLLQAQLDGDTTWLLDAEGRVRSVDADGRPGETSDLGLVPHAGCRLKNGRWALLVDDELLVVGVNGDIHWCETIGLGTAVSSLDDGLVVAAERQPVRQFRGHGREVGTHRIEHPVSLLASCDSGFVAGSESGWMTFVSSTGERWMQALRQPLRDLQAARSGLLAVAGELSTSAWQRDGLLLGELDTEEPQRQAAISPDGSHVLIADRRGVLQLVELGTGLRTWRDEREETSLLRLGEGGRRALVATAGGEVEWLALEPGEQGKRQLEVGEVQGIFSPRREPDAMVAVAEASPIGVDPLGQLVAIVDREQLRVLDAKASPLFEAPLNRDCTHLALTGDGSTLASIGARGFALFDRSGEPLLDRSMNTGCFHLGQDWLIVTDQLGERATTWSRRDGARDLELVDTAVGLIGSDDGESFAVLEKRGYVSCHDRNGEVRWRRKPNVQQIELGAAESRLAAIDSEGRLAWLNWSDGKVLAGLALGRGARLLPWRGELLARLEPSRVLRVGLHETRELAAGPSCDLLQPVSSAKGELQELRISGRTIALRKDTGEPIWTCRAPDHVPTWDAAGAGGLVVFRSGRLLCMLRSEPEGATGASGRGAFLET
ncbi:MAG: hypothetical protein AAF533_13725 [Acidobacteriota bacterium]